MEHKKKQVENSEQKSQLAPGLEGVSGLDRQATSEEIAEGNFTKVTKLEYDEYDPSDV